jgi:hypothetical protein
MRAAREMFHFKIMVAGIIMSLGIFFMNPAMAEQASDAQLVKIMPEIKEDKVIGFYINPQVASIKKNTIVVWMNGISNQEVQLIFQEGKTCKDVTANPNFKMPGFFLDSKNCYSTSFLSYGTTSTLQFVDIGTYDYSVVTEDGKMSAKGKIIVQP